MLKFYFAPFSRSTGVHWLLEEIGAPYEAEHVNIRAKETVPESYRAVQPNKKVPAIDDGGTIVTERAAICLYLCEKYPAANLAPMPGSAERAAFLTSLVYCDAVLDPALAARALKWDYDGGAVSFGSFDDMVANIERMLSSRPFAAGAAFTAADTQLAASLHWAMHLLNVMPKKPVFEDYVARATSRPAFGRSMAIQQKYVAG
jgi:glutathione S-transferase